MGNAADGDRAVQAARAAFPVFEGRRMPHHSLNWPVNRIVCEVASVLAAGCTMVLKPSRIAPPDAIRFAEILEEAGVPPSVFILVNGNGPTAGRALSLHPEVDMTSFPGPTIVGLVLCIGTDADEEGAIRPANDTPCGSAAFVPSGDPVQAFRVAPRIVAELVHDQLPAARPQRAR